MINSVKGIDGFTRYLTSNNCALFNPQKKLPTQSKPTQCEPTHKYVLRYETPLFALFHFVLSQYLPHSRSTQWKNVNHLLYPCT